MLFALLQFFASRFLLLPLHLESGSFLRPLSAQEEADAFAAIRCGNQADASPAQIKAAQTARDTLLRHNLRLVAHIAKKYYANSCEQDDLISIGSIGLIKAVNTFDGARQARFSTYASRCIENALLSPMNLFYRGQNTF